MFTAEQRNYVRSRVLDLAKSDPRVTGGALTGSSSIGAEDNWSDVDVAFGIAEGNSLETVLDDWREAISRELGLLHYWDLPSGPSLYRVFLLPSGIEIDIGLSPEKQFGARGPRFHPVFGVNQQLEVSLRPPSLVKSQAERFAIGLGWHHIFHARSSIERSKPWRAEYWISGLRDETLTLMCLRMGVEANEARGIDLLPANVTAPLANALVHSLDTAELRRALDVATTCFTTELDAHDPALCEQLKPLLQEFGALRHSGHSPTG